jgi:DNA-binding beta-propeller fold protein YncE
VLLCLGTRAAPALATCPSSVPATISVSFGASTVALDGSTSLRFTIANPNQCVGLTSVGFTDSLPDGLVVATPSGLSGDCGGTVTAAAGASSVSLSGGMMSADTLCPISLNVTGTWGGERDNSVTVDSSPGTGNTSTASLTVHPPAVADRVYFANSVSNRIEFANLDGSGGGDLNTGNATVDAPEGVAIDSADGRIYWANYGDNTISFANLDGSDGGDLNTGTATVKGPFGVAVDPGGGRIYWANINGNTIGFAKLDGSGGADLNTGNASVDYPAGVAVDPAAGRIYWGNDEVGTSISFAALDGSNGGDLNTGSARLAFPEGVAVDAAAGRVYWSNTATVNSVPPTISFAQVDGSGGGDLFVGSATLVGARGVAVDAAAGRIYWANVGAAAISFANTDGSGSGGEISTDSASGDGFPALLLAPTAAGSPAITGGSARGSLLSCSQGAWASDQLSAFLYRAPRGVAYQWSVGGAAIAGATSNSYTASADGDYRCRVTASNFVGSTAQTSSAHTIAAPTCRPVSATATAGQPVIIGLACSDRAGATLTYALDNSPSHGTLRAFNAASGEVTYTPAADFSGTDHFAYRATSAGGTASAQIVSIAVRPSSGGKPPAITHARLTNKRFRVARSSTAIAARTAARGTSVRFTLSAPARLQIAITRSTPGRLGGRDCVAPSRKLQRVHAKRCTRTVTVGTLTRADEVKGANSVAFTGRLGRRALSPGAYQARLMASNAGGTSKPTRLAFTIVH